MARASHCRAVAKVACSAFGTRATGRPSVDCLRGTPRSSAALIGKPTEVTLPGVGGSRRRRAAGVWCGGRGVSPAAASETRCDRVQNRSADGGIDAGDPDTDECTVGGGARGHGDGGACSLHDACSRSGHRINTRGSGRVRRVVTSTRFRRLPPRLRGSAAACDLIWEPEYVGPPDESLLGRRLVGLLARRPPRHCGLEDL